MRKIFIPIIMRLTAIGMRAQKTRTLLYILIVMFLVSCTEDKVYKIGVAQCSKGPWREKVNQEMLAAQHLYEHDVKVSIANSVDDPELPGSEGWYPCREF